MEDEVISLQRVEGPFYHYWRQSSLEELNLSSLSPALSGQFPVPNFGLEYAKCFVPKPCAGDTSCTTAYNFGLFCSQCIPGYSFDGVFPASRLCSKCPSSAVVQVRTVVILLLMALFMLAVARSATDVAKGSLSLTLPAVKLLHNYLLVVAMLLDMNFFLVSEMVAQIVRLPLEFLLRPWLLMQVECVQEVFEFPTNGETGDALTIYLQQMWGLWLLYVTFSLVCLKSLLQILWRLISFCGMKLPDFNKENLKALSQHKPNDRRKQSWQSETSEAPVAASASRSTTMSQSINSATYGKMMMRYYWMHFEFKIFSEVRSFIRRVSVIAFLLFPVYLRSLVIPWRCVLLGSNLVSVNVEYLNLFCNTSIAFNLRFEQRFLAMLVAVPGVYVILLILTYRSRKEVPTLEALAFLTAGLNDGKRWWCVITEVRLSMMFFLMSILEQSSLRNLLVLLVLVIYSLLEVRVKPWTCGHNHVLNKASLALNISSVLLSILGAWIRQITGTPVEILNVVVILLLIPTIACTTYGVIMLLLSVLSEVFFGKMHVLLKAGASCGPWTRAVFYANTWCVGNLFEMHLMKSGDRYVLDHSQLNSFNRHQLLTMLVDLMYETLARQGKFRMRMVEMMLVMSFERAMQVRRSVLNANFYENGHRLHALTSIGFPKVLSPDPDLSPLMDLKVTLSELQDALQTLRQDINSDDPELILRSMTKVNDEQHKHTMRRTGHIQTMVWDSASAFQEIEGRVIHNNALFAEDTHEVSMVQTKAPAEEPTATWLSRLTKMMQEQFQKYQAQVEILSKDFQERMLQALAQKRLADAEDRKARLVLAEETLQYSEGLGDGSCEGFEPEAEHAMKAVRKASEAAQDFLAKVKLWEEAADSYFSKYYEILPQICSGEEVSSRAKLNEEQGKKKWEKDLRDAKSACYDAYEKLQRAVEVCKKNPLPRRDPEAVAGDSGRVDMKWTI